MTTTRANPIDTLLDIFHADTNTWVRAAALLQVAGGLNVGLIPDQQALLAKLATNSDRLTGILAEEQGSHASISALQAIAAIIQSVLQSEINPALTSTNVNLASLQAIQINTLNKLEALRSLTNDGVAASLVGISNRTVDYSSALSAIITAMSTLTMATNAALDPSTPVLSKIMLDTANLEIVKPLPPKTKLLMFKCRRDSSGNAQDIRYSFAANQTFSGANYRTLEAYNEYRERFGAFDGSLYLSCANANVNAQVTVEVEAWV